MTTITMTKRGNVKVDGVKFYAVPAGSLLDACDCPLSTSKGGSNTKCGPVYCVPSERREGYRLAGKSVWFISKERYDKFKTSEATA